MDSNHRRRKPADLQSAPFGHSGICPTFHQRTFFSFRASCRIRTNDPEITNHVLWPTELKRLVVFFRPKIHSVCLKSDAKIDINFNMAKYFLKKITLPLQILPNFVAYPHPCPYLPLYNRIITAMVPMLLSESNTPALQAPPTHDLPILLSRYHPL